MFRLFVVLENSATVAAQDPLVRFCRYLVNSREINFNTNTFLYFAYKLFIQNELCKNKTMEINPINADLRAYNVKV